MRAGTQPQERECRYPARRARLICLRVRREEVVARIGTPYAEAQRRYSSRRPLRVAADRTGRRARGRCDRRPASAVALRQQRGATSTRSSVGSVTTFSSLTRMLSSRTGHCLQRPPMCSARCAVDAFGRESPADRYRGTRGLSDAAAFHRAPRFPPCASPPTIRRRAFDWIGKRPTNAGIRHFWAGTRKKSAPRGCRLN